MQEIITKLSIAGQFPKTFTEEEFASFLDEINIGLQEELDSRCLDEIEILKDDKEELEEENENMKDKVITHDEAYEILDNLSDEELESNVTLKKLRELFLFMKD